MENKTIYSRRDFLLKGLMAAGTFTILPSSVFARGRRGPNDRINLAFIGCGRQTHFLVSRFLELPDVQVVAGCDVDRQKLDWFRTTVNAYYAGKTGQPGYEACAGYVKYEKIIQREDIDAVVISTPDHWHAIPAIQAMKAGKDVFCEKPMAHTIEEGRAMANTALKYQRVFQVGSMQRSWHDFRHACELVRNGYLGKIRRVLVNVGDPAVACDLSPEPTPDHLKWDRWLGPASFRPYNQVLSPPIEQTHYPMWRLYSEYGGGILSDWGTHMFDIAQWALGMDESGPSVYLPPADRKATRGLRMFYDIGIEMVHEDFQRGWAVRFIGSEGSLDVSRQFIESNPVNIVGAEIKAGEERLFFSDNHYTNWTDAIRNRSLTVAGAEAGHRSASICNIANIAYSLGRKLEWDPAHEQFMNDDEANRLRGKMYRQPYIL